MGFIRVTRVLTVPQAAHGGEGVDLLLSGGIYNVRVKKHWNRRSKGYRILQWG